MKGYVLCSWYNHWTSIIIEDIFNDHPSVTPAVGRVKKVDFIIKDIPFDLKVTYLPEGFIKEARGHNNLDQEIILLKRFARQHNIHFDNHLNEASLLEDLWYKIKDFPSSDAQRLIDSLIQFRGRLIKDSMNDPEYLIKWLYENQGTRRFDSANRIFLILINNDNYFESWKLKRAKPLLEEKINNYLDHALKKREYGRNIKFTWDTNTYETISDLIFIVSP